jgi:glycine/D-amino acid oxidase-like deaminating enzyme
MSRRSFDVVIVGGGVMGSSIAYHLMRDGLNGTVAILEKDPTYEFATTPRSAGGARQQFSTEINIRIGSYGIGVFERFDEEMAVDGEPAHAEFRRRGYLFLGDERNWDALQRHHGLQRALGADVDLLSPREVQGIVPHLDVARLRGASWGKRAGYMDPYGVLQGYLRKARSLGAHYAQEQVVELLRRGDRMVGVRCASGHRIEGRAIVIAAGAWASEVAASAGILLPIDPVPRMAYCFDPWEKFDYDLPLVIDSEGLYFRHESGRQILTGRARPEEPGFRFDWDRQYFLEDIWPRLACWVPSFERLKLIRGWAGLYAMCRLDQNALIGAYPGIEGLYVAGGFSGHGLQQAPAVGNGISELIRLGRYETMDLSPLGLDRIFNNRRVLEEGVV